MRWSPVKVEILLDDWIPRKIVAPAEYLAKAPDLLQAFIHFAHEEVGLRWGAGAGRIRRPRSSRALRRYRGASAGAQHI
jgi:hypothetical protein